MQNIFKQVWLWIIIVALVIAGAILFYNNNQEEIALTVNGKEFTQIEFDQLVDQIKNQYEMYGMEINKNDIKDQAVDQAVQQILLMELAENEEIETTEEEIEEKKAELIKMYGLETEEELLELLKDQGVSDKDALEDLLGKEIKINKLLDLYSNEVEIAEEDLQSAYEEYKSQTEAINEQSEGEPQEIPSFEEIKEDLRSSLVQKEVTPLILEDVEKLKKEAEIVENVTMEDIKIEESDQESATPQIEIEEPSEETEEEPSEETKEKN